MRWSRKARDRERDGGGWRGTGARHESADEIECVYTCACVAAGRVRGSFGGWLPVRRPDSRGHIGGPLLANISNHPQPLCLLAGEALLFKGRSIFSYFHSPSAGVRGGSCMISQPNYTGPSLPYDRWGFDEGGGEID